MRIKKISPTTPANGNIENQYGTSQTNAYSEAYTNNTFATKVEIPTKTSDLTNDSNFATTDVATTIADGLMSAIDKTKLDGLNDVLQYKGYAREVSLDFNNLTSSGIYYLAGDNFSNAPGQYFWSYLIVIGFGPLKTQIIIKPVSNAVYIREYSGDPATWTSWRKITSTSE